MIAVDIWMWMEEDKKGFELGERELE